jgi:DNA-binding transcriptional MocR family regulator
MTASTAKTWRPSLAEAAGKPIYQALADAIAADIGSGRLKSGDKLPPHRALAAMLGIDLTTVTRAYNEAQRRGLTEAAVGRGTFVRGRTPASTAGARSPMLLVANGMNPPPQPAAASFRERLTAAVAATTQSPDFMTLLTYLPNAGTDSARQAGIQWLRPLIPDATPDRLLVFGGAQPALLALMTTYIEPGDTVLAEGLCYPGFRALAGQLGVQLRGVALDAEGLLPDALDDACRQFKPKALYCVPTIHNPTAASMSIERRREIAAVIRRHGIMVFEDDAYGLLPAAPLPPLATFAPELTFYVSSLAKCIAPGLRIGYMVAPDIDRALRLAAAIRATTTMASPLMAAVAARWVVDGSALKIVQAIRAESAARQTIAVKILAPWTKAAHPQGHHVWLQLPAGWPAAVFAEQARRWGLAAVPASAFAVEPRFAGEAVRLALGASRDQADLTEALRLAATALHQRPEVMSSLG